MRENVKNTNANLKESIKVVPLKVVQDKLQFAYKLADEAYKEASDEWDKPQSDEDANDTLLRMGAAIGMMTFTEELSKFLDRNVVKPSDKEENEQPISIKGEDFLNMVLNAIKEVEE